MPDWFRLTFIVSGQSEIRPDYSTRILELVLPSNWTCLEDAEQRLAMFGDYEDAIITWHEVLFHSVDYEDAIITWHEVLFHSVLTSRSKSVPKNVS